MAKFKQGNLQLNTNQKVQLGDSQESIIQYDGSGLTVDVSSTEVLNFTSAIQTLGVSGDVILTLNPGTDTFDLSVGGDSYFGLSADYLWFGNDSNNTEQIWWATDGSDLTIKNGGLSVVNHDGTSLDLRALANDRIYIEANLMNFLSGDVNVLSLTPTEVTVTGDLSVTGSINLSGFTPTNMFYADASGILTDTTAMTFIADTGEVNIGEDSVGKFYTTVDGFAGGAYGPATILQAGSANGNMTLLSDVVYAGDIFGTTTAMQYIWNGTALGIGYTTDFAVISAGDYGIHITGNDNTDFNVKLGGHLAAKGGSARTWMSIDSATDTILFNVNTSVNYELTIDDNGIRLLNGVSVDSILSVTDADVIDSSSTDKQLVTAKLVYDKVGDMSWDSTALTLTVVGDIVCNDIHVAASTIYVGESGAEIKSTGGTLEFYDNGVKVLETSAGGMVNPVNDISVDQEEKSGWDYSAKDTLEFSVDSTARTFTISDTGGSFDFWVKGTKYTKTGDQTVQFADTEGVWFITFNNSGVLTASQTPWNLNTQDNALVAYVHWDADNQEVNFLGMELHSYSMPRMTHYHFHECIGCLFEEGFGITDNADGTLDISGGQLHDEDISITVTDELGSGWWDQILSPAQLPIYYRDGASGFFRRVYNGTSPTYFTYQDGADNPYWNQFTGGAWQLTASNNNHYSAWWLVATNNIQEPVIVVMGQGSPDNSQTVAQTNNNINDLDFGPTGLAQEFKILYRVMVQNSGAPYTTATITDYRTAQSVGGNTSTVNDHGALNGLADDDHVQYALVDGSRDFTGTVGGIDPVAATDFVTLGYMTELGTGTQRITYDSTAGLEISVDKIVDLDYADFKIGQTPPPWQEGRVFWDDDNHTFGVYNDVSDVTLQVGQETHVRVKNETGSQINNGQVVYISGASGQQPLVSLAIATDHNFICNTSLATHNIANGAFGYVTVRGLVRGVNTSSWGAGDRLYVSATVPGGLQNTPPDPPNQKAFIGTVIVSGNNGSILVNPAHHGSTDQLSDISDSKTDNSILVWDGTAQYYVTDYNISTDGTLAADSNTNIPTEAAVKQYADTKAPAWTYTSITATTSGTSVTLTTAIPTDALEIEVLFNGVSTNTASQPPIVRLGDAGGVETTGYTGSVRGPTGETTVTDGLYPFRTTAWAAADVLTGRMRLSRWDPSLHQWLADGLSQDGSNLSTFSGSKTTSEVLTTITLTTPGGTATFDAGSARVRYR